MNRIALLALVVVLSVGLQIRMQEGAGWTFEFALVALVALSSWTSRSEHLALVALSAFLMNWQAAIAFDLIAFAAIPTLAYTFQTAVPWRRGMANVLLVALSVALFAVATSGTLSVLTSWLLWKILIGSIVFGVTIFVLFEAVYEPPSKIRMMPYQIPP